MIMKYPMHPSGHIHGCSFHDHRPQINEIDLPILQSPYNKQVLDSIQMHIDAQKLYIPSPDFTFAISSEVCQ